MTGKLSIILDRPVKTRSPLLMGKGLEISSDGRAVGRAHSRGLENRISDTRPLLIRLPSLYAKATSVSGPAEGEGAFESPGWPLSFLTTSYDYFHELMLEYQHDSFAS